MLEPDSSARAATVSAYFRSFANANSAGSLSLPCFREGCDEAAGRGEIARARHFAVGAGGGQRDRVADVLEQMRRGARQQPRAHGLGGAAQQLLALLGRQVDANAGLDREFRIALRLLQHDGITATPTSARRDW